MKYFVTRTICNDLGIEFYALGENADDIKCKECSNLIGNLRSAVNAGNRIYEIDLIDGNVLKIKYIYWYDDMSEIKTALFYLNENIPIDGYFYTELLKIIKVFNSKAQEDRDKIDEILKNRSNKNSQIASCQTILKKYLLAGFIIDDKTGQEAERTFTTMLAEKERILDKLELPLPFKSKMRLVFYKFLRPTIYQDKLNEIKYKWKLFVWKSFVSDYSKKRDFFLESSKPTEVLPPKTVEDPFIRFILADIDYIMNIGSNSYTQELNLLEDLVKRYIESKKNEILRASRLDMESFLNELTDLELNLFGKNSKIGLKRSNKGLIREDFIKERLNYIGILSDTSIENDYLSLIYKLVKKITSYPYEGCEASLVELYKIAADFIKEKNEEKTEGLLIYTPERNILKRITSLELEIDQKIDRCRRAEALAQDMELLESSIESARTIIQNSPQEKKPYVNRPKNETT